MAWNIKIGVKFCAEPCERARACDKVLHSTLHCFHCVLAHISCYTKDFSCYSYSYNRVKGGGEGRVTRAKCSRLWLHHYNLRVIGICTDKHCLRTVSPVLVSIQSHPAPSISLAQLIKTYPTTTLLSLPNFIFPPSPVLLLLLLLLYFTYNLLYCHHKSE